MLHDVKFAIKSTEDLRDKLKDALVNYLEQNLTEIDKRGIEASALSIAASQEVFYEMVITAAKKCGMSREQIMRNLSAFEDRVSQTLARNGL